MQENFSEIYEHEEPETIEVGMEEYKMVKAPNIIETTPLGPCVGIIVYDPNTKQATVGHFVDPRVNNNMQKMLGEVVEKFRNKEKLRVYVGGQAPDHTDAPYFTEDKDKRAFIKKQLETHGFKDSQITINYQDSHQGTILRIDTTSGNVEYDQEDYWENEEN